MFRRACSVVRWLLLLAVLPLTVVLYTTNAATAATYGPAVPFSFTQDLGMQADARCNGNAVYAVQDSLLMEVELTLKCVIDIVFQNDPGVGDITGDTTVNINGATSAGQVENCDSGGGSTGDPIAGISITVSGLVPDCQIEYMCVTGNWDQDISGMFDEHYDFEWCGDLPMGPPPGQNESCNVGMPSRVTLVPHNGADTGWGSGQYWGHQVKLSFALGANNGLHQDYWDYDAKYPVAGGGPVPDVNRGWKTGRTQPAYGQWAGSSFETPPGAGGGNLYSDGNLAGATPIGIWIIAVGPGVERTRALNTYTYGDNDPGQCVFYFGPKFRDDPNSELDEPSGSIDGTPVDPGGSSTPPDLTPPDPPPAAAGCDFVLSDPSTWATAGICALVGLIARLIDIVGGIAAAILNGLKALFIPSEGFLDGEMRDMKALWKDTAPGDYLTAFSELDPGSASGCSGLPLNVDLGGGVVIDERLGNACSGTMASVAALVRLALSAVLCVAGAIACVRFVGSGFGWAPQIGRVDP